MQAGKSSIAFSTAFFLGAISCGGLSIADAAPSPAPRAPAIEVLSNRADLISGGDALIDIVPQQPASSSTITMTLNGSDVTSQFSKTAQGTLRGLLTGLVAGTNTFAVHSSGGDASATLINHPSGGPLFSGPQLQPWTCQQGAQDAQCNQAPSYSYAYISTDPAKQGFQSYDPSQPATDVANTTTDQGITLPFIVRVETGYVDRDQYKIAALYQPGIPWTVQAPQPQFNHKLLITHGASCGVSYTTGGAPSVTSYAPAGGADTALDALAAGFAVMSTALDNSGHNCNLAIQAESLVMAKEYLIERYGTLRYTIGAGCSGGSLAMQWIANAYPGIYQGLLPTCSFPDAWTTATQFVDYHLLIGYFSAPAQWGTDIVWTEAQRGSVEGTPGTLNSQVSENAQFHVAVPTDPCPGTTDTDRYDPVTNPGGVRCTITDAAINLFGPRPPELWTANEATLGRGFAGFPLDNIGVQYGLSSLQQGDISPAQFLDLNTKVGGLDVDTNPTPQRVAAVEPALSNAYRSGMINETSNLNQTAIIDCRGPNPGLFHDVYRAFAVRARLDREHGTHANQVIWEGPLPILADTQCNGNSFVAMDRWLKAVERDRSNLSLAGKLVADKPADIQDECWNGLGRKRANGLCGDHIVPIRGTPRTVAGDAITTDTNKCQLKPLDRSDNYGPRPFTDTQWSQLQQLFPQGVCDFSQPGVSQQPTIAWQTYQDTSGGVIYGGSALPPPPTGSGLGWASAAFKVFTP